MTICLILVSAAEVSAQDQRTSGWYVSGGSGGNLVYGLDQAGSNTDSTCYPTSAASIWFYGIFPVTGGVTILPPTGVSVSTLPLDGCSTVPALKSHSRPGENNVDQGPPLEITYLDGTSAGTSSFLGLGLAQAVSSSFIEDQVIRTVSLNAYYDLPIGPQRITPYVGVGDRYRVRGTDQDLLFDRILRSFR